MRAPRVTVANVARGVVLTGLATCLLGELPARAQALDPSEPPGLPTAPDASRPSDALPAVNPRRYEFFPVPNIGGNSDVGVEVGVAFTLARFYDDAYPYKWALTGLFSASFKDDADGFRAVEQSHVLSLDLADLLKGKVRVITTANFTREVDARWYGIGNASVVGGTPKGADPTRYNEYVDENAGLRTYGRIKTGTLFDAAFAGNFRFENPEPFAVTKLGEDAKSQDLAGTKQAFVSTLAAGVVIDTRDDEFVPRKGVYYQAGIAGTVGTQERVGYGEASAVLSSYLPVAKWLTLANRVLADFQVGRVPFYDLQQGSVFNQQYMVGGIDGVRGVRLGRYAGRAKILANYELRATPLRPFRIAGFKIQIGNDAFFDAGRVWSDYDTPQYDGTSLGVKWGAGGGFFFQFDKSSVFRVEVAYSPDESSVSFYLASGLIF
jgi:hypothetical protein